MFIHISRLVRSDSILAPTPPVHFWYMAHGCIFARDLLTSAHNFCIHRSQKSSLGMESENPTSNLGQLRGSLTIQAEVEIGLELRNF